MGYNVFNDMEMPDPETELAKAEIVSQLRALLTENELTEAAAAKQWGISEAEVVSLLQGHWGEYSVERLLRFVNRLDRNVRIVIETHDIAAGEKAKTLVSIA